MPPVSKRIRLLQKNKERYDKKYRFIDALNYVPRFQVRLGQLAKIGVDQNGEPIFQQKRVDLMLGVDMALLAGKGKITHTALFAGDSDTIAAVEAVKQEGVIVTLWHGKLPATVVRAESFTNCVMSGSN